MYYTANDIAQAKFVLIDNEDTFHPQPGRKTFQPKPSTGVGFRVLRVYGLGF